MSIPDEDIFPHATGAAQQTVQQHSADTELVFYAGWFCPFVQRAWISLEEKGIPYQYKEVNPYKKEKHFLDINPKGLVPAIEYKSKALYESLIICEFLEDAYPDTPRLFPTDPFERAYTRLWIDHISKNVIPCFFRLLQAQEPEKRATALKDYKEALLPVAEQVKGPYFNGERWCLVDTVIAPFIVRDYILSNHRDFHREDVGPRWADYAGHVERRGSVQRTASENYAKIYGRYLRDEAQSEAAKATREGRAPP
ncbi:glutathione-S-transferase [Gloeopeniophorella convolvens]|nr:glutathione-S-transferase [Gloeopeniophorella convolvens]